MRAHGKPPSAVAAAWMITGRVRMNDVIRGRTSMLTAATALMLGACTAGVTTTPPGSVSATSTPDAQSSDIASPTAGPSLAAAPSEAVGAPTVAWEAPEPFDGQVTDVFADGDTWVAGGWTQADGPAAWTSADGQVWDPADVENQLPDETFRGPRLGPIDRLGDSLLSIGTFIGCCDGRGVYGWRSAEGTSWEAIESSSPLYAQGYFVKEIAVGDPALVAIEIQYAEFGGRIWTWTEETSWVETTPGADPSAPFGSGIQLSDVVWAQGRFVAVGDRGESSRSEPISGTSWASVDGQTWEESTPSESMEGVRLTSVAGLPAGGFSAIGYVEAADLSAGEAVAFTSPDGLAWTAVPAAFGDVPWMPADLVEVPGGLLAFGTAVWGTSDGTTWTQTDSLAGGFIAAATIDDEIVAFVQDQNPENLAWMVQRGTVMR